MNRKRDEAQVSNRPVNMDRESGSRNDRHLEDIGREGGLDRNRMNDLYERSSI